MRFRSTLYDLGADVRSAYRRYGLPTGLLLAVTLIVTGQLRTEVTDLVETPLFDVTAKIAGVISRPVGAMEDGVREIRAFMDVRAENRALRLENESLRRWQQQARLTATENAALRGVLAMAPPPSVEPFVSARVVAASPSIPLGSIIIDAGREEGILEGHVVVTPVGMVGEVIETGNHAARVMLVTHARSRIPVFGERSGKGAVVSGGQSHLLQFLHVAPDETSESFIEGELVFTSAQGGRYPPLLPLGTVMSFEGEMRIRPEVDIGGLRIVQILGSEGFPLAPDMP